MKKVQLLLCLITGFVLNVGIAHAQNSDSTGLPGDHFSLQGALEMFKKANSIEEFEKLINTESNNVNNLDLNSDGEIDYVSVIDKTEKEVHAFVLQVAVSETETQDIAVIELEKTGDEEAILQIVGDEEIYGEQVIVEASDGTSGEDENNPGTNGPSFNYYTSPNIVVNVWLWPSVRFVYRPAYVAWASPWHWRSHPVWWHPWRPFAWRVFHPRAYRYHPFCRVVHTHRVFAAHRVYTPFRRTSVFVHTRHATAVTHYRGSRSIRKVTVSGPRGTRTTTTIRGKDGDVKYKETKVKGKGRRG